ncbi:hypothetical protein CVT26_005502 [Gymnopilus dilepis]|uniref:Uncharacterized protein n=1 Tax=Gymnopilus dilepis TaxID=231916 RepID=A0A409WJL5_9AGAR|nr:hypothetical protein CVT26_005502 [Gymnopilus dilepis]
MDMEGCGKHEKVEALVRDEGVQEKGIFFEDATSTTAVSFYKLLSFYKMFQQRQLWYGSRHEANMISRARHVCLEGFGVQGRKLWQVDASECVLNGMLALEVRMAQIWPHGNNSACKG